ncbi:MAG: hypothetical protein NZ873_00395, partial [Crenarchaeota archaeon]|nr:hypothetical protein [Thermoproteota archaeon]MDW8033597.1 hypothetical protein [Nitrososphaerota archaeon]
RNGCTLLEYVGGCCLEYSLPSGLQLTKAPFLQRGPPRRIDENVEIMLPSLHRILQDATGDDYEDYLKQIGEILINIGMVVEGLGSSQAKNILLLTSKHNEVMRKIVKDIASVSIEEASRLVILAGLLLNLKRAIEALDAISFFFEGGEEPIEAQRKNVKEASEILLKAFGNLKVKREEDLDEVLSRFKLLKMTLGGVDRIRSNTLAILIYKMAFNGYCLARVARGLV